MGQGFTRVQTAKHAAPAMHMANSSANMKRITRSIRRSIVLRFDGGSVAFIITCRTPVARSVCAGRLNGSCLERSRHSCCVNAKHFSHSQVLQKQPCKREDSPSVQRIGKIDECPKRVLL